jgi:hypothetical protein
MERALKMAAKSPKQPPMKKFRSLNLAILSDFSKK